LSYPGRPVLESATPQQNEVSRCPAVFAFTAHDLARELHQINALKPNEKPSSCPRGLINSRLLRSQSVASAMGTHRARPRRAAPV
jgi:hypothetical protein